LQSEMLYSPHPPMSYSRDDGEGQNIGVGRELAGEDRRAWWNLYWLSDPAIDFFLKVGADWNAAPSISFDMVLAAAKTVNKQKLGGEMIAPMLLTLTPTAFVQRLRQHKHDHLYVAKVHGPGWLDLVSERAQGYRGSVSTEGKVAFVNFGRKPVDQKVQQPILGSATIMPLA
jgi:hypothetical protein